MNKMLTVTVNALIWDKHASATGIGSLMVCLLGGTLYQQPPKRDSQVYHKVAQSQPSDEASLRLLRVKACCIFSLLVVLAYLVSNWVDELRDWVDELRDRHSLQLENGTALDALVVAASADCTTMASARSLLLFGRPHVGTVYLIMPAVELVKCEQKTQDEARLHCLNERVALNMTGPQVHRVLSNKGAAWAAAGMQHRSFWYYQQLIKLLAHRALAPSLSSTFVIWDSDQILVRPLFFLKPSSFFSEARLLLRVGVGGHNMPEYCPAVKEMLHGVHCVATDGMVTHSMVVQTQVLEDLLHQMCGADDDPHNSSVCAETILKRIPQDADPNLSLSEYTLYLSWALARYPENHAVASATSFLRIETKSFNKHSSCKEEQDQLWWSHVLWLRLNIKSVILEARSKAERKHAFLRPDEG